MVVCIKSDLHLHLYSLRRLKRIRFARLVLYQHVWKNRRYRPRRWDYSAHQTSLTRCGRLTNDATYAHFSPSQLHINLTVLIIYYPSNSSSLLNLLPTPRTMFPRTLHTSLALFPFVITLVHCSSIEFFVDQTFDECSRNSQTVACANNTDRGGLCAYAPDTRKLWCCPAPNPYVRTTDTSFPIGRSNILTSCSGRPGRAGVMVRIATAARRRLRVPVRYLVRVKALVRGPLSTWGHRAGLKVQRGRMVLRSAI